MGIANVKYKRPTQNEQKRTTNMLKYLTYRDGRDGYIKQVSGKERWVNHGMGASVTEIAEQCDQFQSEHVLLFSLVINSNPDLVAMIPHEDRERFLRLLTDNTVNDFFDERGIDTGVEYSWVMHHRMTDDGEASGRHDPHTHIILPGTYYERIKGVRDRLQRLLEGYEPIHPRTWQERLADGEVEPYLQVVEYYQARPLALFALYTLTTDTKVKRFAKDNKQRKMIFYYRKKCLKRIEAAYGQAASF